MTTRTSIIAVAALSVLLLSPNIGAALYNYRWCTTWKSNFTDASGDTNHEDIYPDTGDVQRRSEWSYYRIFQQDGEDWDQIGYGFLTDYEDGRYCSDYVEVSPGETYKFRQYTYMKRSNRRAYVSGADGWGDNWMYLGTITNAPINLKAGSWTNTFEPVNVWAEATVAVIVSRIMDYAITHGWPNSSTEKMWIKTRKYNECDAGPYHYEGRDPVTQAHKICVANTPDIVSRKKFAVAHEIGHAIWEMMADQAGHNGEYDADDTDSPFSPSEQLCTCDHYGEYMLHCMQSREFIGRAAMEGYAHFVASSTFNVRETDGWFHYFGDIDYGGGTGVVYYPWIDVSADGGNDYEQWIYSHCNPQNDDTFNVGSDWDWLQFFWNMWTNGGDYNWETTEMVQVWHDTTEHDWECCDDEDPTDCVKKDSGVACTNPRPFEARYGKVWDDLWSSAQDLGSDEGWDWGQTVRFSNVGADAKIRF